MTSSFNGAYGPQWLLAADCKGMGALHAELVMAALRAASSTALVIAALPTSSGGVRNAALQAWRLH